MDLDYVEVTRDNCTYRYPIEKLKVIDIDDNGAEVVVKYPSYLVEGRITLETLAKLLARRLKGYSLQPKRQHRILTWVLDGPVYGPEESVIKRLQRLWWKIELETPE